MNEEIKNQKMTEDILSILTQAKDRQWKVSKSELVSSLRNKRGCNWYSPESKRSWRMSAYFINSDLDDLLEEMESQGQITIHRTHSKPNAMGNTFVRCLHYTI